MSAPTKGCFEKIDELKPLWVATIKLVGSAGQFAVQAAFPKCSCGLKQTRVGCTLSRNVDQAASDVLVKVSTCSSGVRCIQLLSHTTPLAICVPPTAPAARDD